jgi:predicted patatin/cPLA2 family phospholipase
VRSAVPISPVPPVMNTRLTINEDRRSAAKLTAGTLRFATPMFPRRHHPDAFRPAAKMTEDRRAHPVVQTILRRRDEGSRPGARSDGRRVALVIEWGGLRGVVSAGMTAAIEQLGLRDAFDEVHGSSAGAFNGAFLLAGQAAYLATLYQQGFGDPGYVSLVRPLRGGPVFDMDYVIDHVWTKRRPLRFDAISASGIGLHCTATDTKTASVVDLTDLTTEEEIRCAMRASSRLPWLAGGPVAFRGRTLLDATLAEAIPVHAATCTATDMLVLQTRPHGIDHTPLSPAVGRLTDGYLRAINPALVELRRTRSQRYDRLTAELAARMDDPGQVPAVCVLRPPAGSTIVGQLERRTSVLRSGADDGIRTAWMAFTGQDPEVLRVPRAYPAGGGLPRSSDDGPPLADSIRFTIT